MVTIVFESHSTSLDNENHLSSGWNDIELSPLGIEQAKDLGKRRKDEKFDAIFCSDLQRSYKTAEIAFGNKFPIIKDFRLRECNYGDLTQYPSEELDKEKPKRIKTPFPNGESYEQASERMRSFLKDILPHLKNTPLEKKINDLIENTGKYQTQNISYFPKKGN